jgi:hypothetical protein
VVRQEVTNQWLVVGRTRSGWHSAVQQRLTRDLVRQARINQSNSSSFARVVFTPHPTTYSYSFCHLKPKEYGLKVLSRRTLTTAEPKAVDKSVRTFLRVHRILLRFVLYMHAQDSRRLIKSASFVLNDVSDHPMHQPKLNLHLDSPTRPPLSRTHCSPKYRSITQHTPPPKAQAKTAPSNPTRP